MSSFMPQGSNPLTASFTCNTCGIRFVTADLQRQHMKTDWHRYNLKRRVAQLPSISSEMFAEKVLSQQNQSDEEDEEDEYGFHINHRKSSKGSKQLTKKYLKKQAKFDELRKAREEREGSHARALSPVSISSEFSQFSLGDSEHLSVNNDTDTGSELNYTDTSEFTDLDITADDEDYTDSDMESDEELDVIPITHCFFCGANNKEVETNVKHMFNSHGLYIPERSFLVDLEGLLAFLSEIFTVDLECLVCGFLGKNLESIRQHLRSKGHCRIPYESKEEKSIIAEFYDFNVDEGNTKSKTNKKVTFTESGDADDEVLVDVVPSSPELEDPRASTNSNYSVVHVDRSGVELTLPTGSRIGHRSMARYYRQNIALPRDIAESEKTVAVVDRRFAPGLSYHDISKQEKETRRLAQQSKNDYIRKSKPHRMNFQPHFRDEILQ
mmetsp:Transcript_6091/g.6021  ORF Transcript_6091/g.6021 Transcript_6091/m.6021 type:complete len:439 (+) Transcript_6091:29-1345(+)